MFVGHYKSVNTPEEFYTEKRESLSFPAQVEVSGKRYSLSRTYHVVSDSKYEELKDMAKKNNVDFGVKLQ